MIRRLLAFAVSNGAIFGAVELTDRFAGVLTTAGNNLPAEPSPAWWPYLVLGLIALSLVSMWIALRPKE